MKRILLAFLLTAGLIGASAPPALALQNENHLPKVTICHRTGSTTNPFVEITVNAHALKGHGVLDIEALVAAVELETGADISAYITVESGHEGDLFFLGNVGCPGPEGPPGSSPELTILCFPGLGLGVLVDYDGESQLPDGSHILGNGAICPLAGENGKDGVDGKDGSDGVSVTGPVGPAGPQGVTGESVSSVTTVTGETTTTTAPPVPLSGSLPRTGSSVVWLAGLGALAVAMGTGLRFFRTRTN